MRVSIVRDESRLQVGEDLGHRHRRDAGRQRGAADRGGNRVFGLRLKTSQTIRLGRLFKGSVYKEDAGQVVFPIAKTPDLTGTIVELLRLLVPPGE